MKTIDSGGVRIAFSEHGAAGAPPLVFLHSLGLDHAMWSGAVERFAGSYRVICPDLRGHGASQAPAGTYTTEDLALDVLAVIEHAAGARRVHLCGLSLGGLVALWLGLHRTDRIRTVCVVASAARVGTREGWQARMDAVARGGLAAVRDVVLERFFSHEFAERHPECVARAGATLTGTSMAGYLGCCAAVRDTDLRDEAASLALPLLVVAGGGDVACPPESSRQLTEGRHGGAFLQIDGAGHLVPLEQPDAFAEALATFIAGYPG